MSIDSVSVTNLESVSLGAPCHDDTKVYMGVGKRT